jgi:hypothetical protein
MAKTLGLMPFVQLREFNDSGMLLAGGKIYFYRAGSTTPLATYEDAQGVTANPNPVVLDSAGSAKIFLLPAKYRVEIYDADGGLIHEIDEIGSASGATLGGTGSLAIVSNYDELRNLDQDFDAVLVLGRTVASDGGQGLFLKTDSTADDDDGILLVRGSSTRYLRELNGYVDPVWYGVEYSNDVDQRTYLLKAFTAGITYKAPVQISGDCYLGTNTTVPTGCRLIINGSLYGPATAPPTITFADNAVIESCSNAGLRLPVKLGLGCVRTTIKSSWFGGGADVELARISAISDEGYTVVIDKEYSLGVDVAFPANLAIDFDGGRFKVDIGTIDITINTFIYEGKSQIFEFTSKNYVNTVDLGVPSRPEWFGALADGSTDDSDAFYAACSTGNVILDDKTYRLCQDIEVPDGVSIKGNLANALVYPNPLTANDIPEPKLKFGVVGEPYKLNPVASTDYDKVVKFAIPDLIKDLVVSSSYFGGKYIVATCPGYIYRIDVVSGVNEATKLTSISRKWRYLWQKGGNLYGLIDGIDIFHTDIYKLDISGDTATETLVFSSTSFGVKYICNDISSTTYVANSLGTVKTLDTTTWTLGSDVGEFSNLCRGLVGVDGLLYGINVTATTEVYSIESMTTGGVVATVATLTGYKAKSLAQFDHNLYVAQFEGEVLKVTTAGVVSVWTTNASDLKWNSIETVNDSMIVFSRSRIPGLSTETGSLYTSAEGIIQLEGLSVDGSDSIDGIAIISTQDGPLGLTNVVTYFTACNADIIAKDSMLDYYTEVFSTASEVSNCIKVNYDTTDLKRYFYDNLAFKNVYLTENKKDTVDADYDNLLATDADGKVVNGVDVKLKTVEVDELMINTLMNVSSKVVSDLNYTVSNDDPILIAFTGTSNQTIVTLPATVPDGKPKFRIIVRAQSSNYYMSINAAECHLGNLVTPYLPPLIAGAFFTNKTMAFCYFVEGKWAIC